MDHFWVMFLIFFLDFPISPLFRSKFREADAPDPSPSQSTIVPLDTFSPFCHQTLSSPLPNRKPPTHFHNPFLDPK